MADTADTAEPGPSEGGFVREGVWHSVPRRTVPDGPAEALILVDVQTAFLTGPDAVPEAAGLTARLTALLERARAAGAVVIHLRNDGEPGAPDEPGTPGWHLALPVRESARETVVSKESEDGFEDTGLGALLDGHGVRSVVVAGVLSEMCVSATALGALDHGLRVVLPHDTHTTYGLDDLPPAVVSKVAEHALGPDPEFVTSAAGVTFTAPGETRG
ncbi:isochorismatase family protein [Streptomyces qinzhouensis]|uniref:Isochorismatase family protein n=1 Tax=Streptomyces qinzhouensis TaxID=2599401 RepID=A0A5B8JDV7_9ACTN|nr:isochorismatase family protein [Streptomyces qinzhouensis]QDY79915.1 isochorismatase family protein [Streptomyces qinzhouensis]